MPCTQDPSQDPSQEAPQEQVGAGHELQVEKADSSSPPLSPFGVTTVQAAADRTSVTDGRFSSIQRLSGTPSTSQPQQVCYTYAFVTYHPELQVLWSEIAVCMVYCIMLS